jgi:hypothetical protein
MSEKPLTRKGWFLRINPEEINPALQYRYGDAWLNTPRNHLCHQMALLCSCTAVLLQRDPDKNDLSNQ